MKKTVKGMILLTLALAICLSQIAYAEPSKEVKGIYESLIKEGSGYSELKNQYAEYFPEMKVEEELGDDGFTITFSESEGMDGSWSFLQDGDYLTVSFPGDDFTALTMALYVVRAVGDFYGLNTALVSGYVNGLTSLDIPNENFILTEDEATGSTGIRIYIADAMDMQELDKMVIGETELSFYDPLGEGFHSYATTVGKLTMVANGSAEDFTVLLGEYEGLDDLAYQSILNIAGILKPQGWEDFTEGYQELSDAETPGYTVTLGVTEEQVKEIVDEIFEGYSYAILHFGA